MKTCVQFAVWAFFVCVIVYAALSPDGGAVYQNPMTAVGLGLIGLGLIKQARDHEGSAAESGAGPTQ